MKTALTIRNAEVVLPVRTERTNVSVINGRICAIGNEIPDVGEVIDADGLFLLPGSLIHRFISVNRELITKKIYTVVLVRCGRRSYKFSGYAEQYTSGNHTSADEGKKAVGGRKICS